MKQKLRQSTKLKPSLVYGAGISFALVAVLAIWVNLSKTESSSASVATVKFVGVFPEPFIDKFNITVETNQASEIKVSLSTQQRKLIKEFTYEIAPGSNKLLFNPGCFMAKGIYMLKVNRGDEVVYNGKIICK